MARPSEDDREAVDRAFAEMIASYHLTAERAEPIAPASTTKPEPDGAWADQHPLFRFPEPEPEVAEWRELERQQNERGRGEQGARGQGERRRSEERRTEDRYVPEPLPPLRRPGVPAMLGWIGIGYAVLVVLVAATGVSLPAWVGWLAVGSFLVGFAILISQLPRHRPPDAGDGAVL